MNSPASSNDDSLPESDATLEQAPQEPSFVSQAGEPTVPEPEVSEPVPTATPEPESAPKPEPALKSEPASEAEPTFTSAPAPSGVPPVPAPVTTVQRDGRNAAGWALLLAMSSIAIAGFSLWQAYGWRVQNMELREEIAKRLQESDNAIIESRALARREHESLNAVLGKVGALESQISKSEGHAKALEALYEQFSRSQEDRIAAEVRQAVEFADQQLRYAGNIETALIALRGAQARLEQNDHGQFAALRQALATDIEKLSQQGTLDMPGTALRLENVLGKIDKLPLNSGEISAGEPVVKPREEGEGVGHFALRLVDEIWADLRSLVKFERLNAEAEPVLLAPKESAFLRENVKIRLLTARLAMLARDGYSYAADLKQARDWVERFFNMSNEDVKAVVEELRALESIPAGFIQHELVGSTAAVRRFQTRGGELPPMPSPPRSRAQPQNDASGQAAGEAPAPPVQP
jgi:uroporphyrin-3 C-methyltransferase